MKRWTDVDIPDLRGKTAIVTDASSGVGFEIAQQLALHGAQVVLASRDLARTEEAAGRIKAVKPGARVEAHRVDLGDLASVHSFASLFVRSFPALDILINNAGISGGPHRLTRDGFEMNFQVNYLGHFALTGLLLRSLIERRSRVVSMSSDIASSGRIKVRIREPERSARKPFQDRSGPVEPHNECAAAHLHQTDDDGEALW